MPLIQEIKAKGTPPDSSILQGSFDTKAQSALCNAIAVDLGFSLEQGRLDVSVHPFTGGQQSSFSLCIMIILTTILVLKMTITTTIIFVIVKINNQNSCQPRLGACGATLSSTGEFVHYACVLISV